MDFFDKAILLAKKSLKTNDVPVGALVVLNNKIIGEGYNRREKRNFSFDHAEINAIKHASKKLKTWNLEGSVMYVTLKPCPMCTEVIKQSRISKVFYLLEKPEHKKEYSKTIFEKVENNKLKECYKEELTDFFKKIREKKQNGI